ncbi:amidohydrolase [Bacteroidota bacterium]|nr:amidohydrolase [Bacteroidota bacterium]
MDSLKTEIKSLASKIQEEVVSIRRNIHLHPELSNEEVKTAEFISQKLTEWEIPHSTKIAGNGICVLLKGELSGEKVIAIRGELDALPIYEKNEVSYKSCNQGVMHACGHDVHSAALLGTLRILQQLKSHWGGTIKAIFQPAEEKLPGGGSVMIANGILKNPKPDSILALHVFPTLEYGKVGFREGQYMASCDELFITVTGKGGHAAMPGEYNNPLFISARLLNAYENLIEEIKTQTIPTVIAFGKITGAGATNVIPDEVKIEGTFRTMDEVWRKTIHEKLKSIAKKIAVETSSTIEVKIAIGYPCLYNNPSITTQSKKAAQNFLGKENVVDIPLRMTSDDFAFYSHEIPGCYFRLGTRNEERGIISPVHTATFDIEEKALETATGTMAWIALQLLNSQ